MELTKTNNVQWKSGQTGNPNDRNPVAPRIGLKVKNPKAPAVKREAEKIGGGELLHCGRASSFS
jgi:hypothetical protein